MSAFDAIKNLFEERRAFSRRLVVAAVFSLLLLVLLILRLLQLQVFEHNYYSTRSDDNRMRVVPVPPVRGLIYDRNGVLLAQNLPSFDLVVTRDQVTNLADTLAALRKILPITPADIERFQGRLSKTPRYRPVPLLTDLSQQEVARFEVNRYQYSGVDIQAGLVREYPLGTAASHVIGYVGGITAADLNRIDPDLYAGLDQIGRTGVERSHENELRGTPGTKIVETNAAGRPLRELNYQPGTPGKNLYLTIDARLQKLAWQAMGDLDGAVVAIDPRNGEVLAMVSKPGFDPTLFVNGLTQANYESLLKNPHQPLYDRALQGTYAPGSTIKPFMAYAGLQSGTLTDKTHYFCPGYFTLPGSTRRFRCWKRSGHGMIDLQTAIQQSCDVFFYNVAIGLGIDRIDKLLAPFGFGRDTGIDLPNERHGLLPSATWKKRNLHHLWYPGETLNIGIGQGYWKVTPLQLAQATTRIAMRGAGFVPHIAHALGDPTTGQITAVTPEPLPVIPTENPDDWTQVVDGMERAAQQPHGTAYRIGHNAPYGIAAKTGSAQVIGMAQNVGSQHNQSEIAFKLRDNGLFIAFAPADHPKIAIAVVAEHDVHGGDTAADVARKLMDMDLLGKVDFSTKPPSGDEVAQQNNASASAANVGRSP